MCKLYRYYISPALKDPSKYERGEITKISAGEIEQYVKDDLDNLLADTLFIQKYLENYSIEKQNLILKEIQNYNPDKVFIRTVVKSVDLKLNSITINYDINYIIQHFATMAFNASFKYSSEDEFIISR